MTVLVTGGAGYIGSHMLLALRGHGRPVVALDNLSTGHRWAVPEDVPFVEGDCGDEALLVDVISRHAISAIIHFAGSISVPESMEKPFAYYLNNTVKSRALFAVGQDMGIDKIIFSSSAGVYGEGAGDAPLSESARLAPISPYGMSKLMSEFMLRDAAATGGLRYVALRYFNVAGADPYGRAGQTSRRATHLIKVASQAALGERAFMEIYGDDYPTPDGTCVRDYIHVTDLVEAHLRALDYLEEGGGSLVLNCGYGRGYSVRQVVDVVQRISGVDFEVRRSPRREGDPASLVACADLIRERLGWVPRLADLDTIVTHALAWEALLKDRQRRQRQMLDLARFSVASPA